MRICALSIILTALALGLPAVSVGTVDLEIDSFFAPPVAYRGEPIGGQILLQIRNTGPDDITSFFFVGFYISTDEHITISDQLLIGGRESVAGLAAGEEVNVPLWWGAYVPSDYPLGPAFLGVIVDEFNVIPEDDETNNTASSAVDVIDEVPVQTQSWGSIKMIFR